MTGVAELGSRAKGDVSFGESNDRERVKVGERSRSFRAFDVGGQGLT